MIRAAASLSNAEKEEIPGTHLIGMKSWVSPVGKELDRLLLTEGRWNLR
jgi:hypothetical protein